MGLSDVLAGTMFESAEEMAEMSARELLRKLKDNDCTELRQKGSHLQVKCGGCQSTVPVHGSKDIARGTLKSIEKSLGVCLGSDWTKIEHRSDPTDPIANYYNGNGDKVRLGFRNPDFVSEAKKKGGGSDTLPEVVRKIGVFAKTQGGVIRAYAGRLNAKGNDAPRDAKEAVAKLQGLMDQVDAAVSQVAGLVAEVEKKL